LKGCNGTRRQAEIVSRWDRLENTAFVLSDRAMTRIVSAWAVGSTS
jgi:hypothetical protein